MSVLSFPRIYFRGFMEWDPCTFNNNGWQAFQTYDATNAGLNWSFLATQNPPITPDNFTVSNPYSRACVFTTPKTTHRSRCRKRTIRHVGPN
jgi:hypothetical protein